MQNHFCVTIILTWKKFRIRVQRYVTSLSVAVIRTHSSSDARTISWEYVSKQCSALFLCRPKLILSILFSSPNILEQWSWNQNEPLSRRRQLKFSLTDCYQYCLWAVSHFVVICCNIYLFLTFCEFLYKNLCKIFTCVWNGTYVVN